MLKSRLIFLAGMAFAVALYGCTCSGRYPARAASTNGLSETDVDNNANAEAAKLMDLYGKAMLGLYDETAVTRSGESVTAEFEAALASFDSNYNSHLRKDFVAVHDRTLRRVAARNRIRHYDHSGMPLDTDGAVYLGGAGTDPLAVIVTWMTPVSTRGRYHHGAVFDLDKFDRSDMECLCFETAVAKGAGYQTPNHWRYGIKNVCVLNPATPPDPAALDAAHQAIDVYCATNNKNMQYGFFKHYIDIFEIVTKEDNYYWYCTKVVWRLYDLLHVDVDSNSDRIDWTTSGLYKIVKACYCNAYYYDPQKVRRKTREYVENAKRTLVIADEIYYSPYLTKVYEDIAN